MKSRKHAGQRPAYGSRKKIVKIKLEERWRKQVVKCDKKETSACNSLIFKERKITSLTRPD